MPTNKIVLRTVDQFMGDYLPTYQAIYPLFLSKSQQYSDEVGRMDFRRMTAMGDIRAKHITPKDTEIKQVSVNQGTKSFKKYFLANQFRQSEFQDLEGVEDIVKQVLDEHQVQMDEMFLLGEGTSDSTMINNGLYWSGDENYTLETSGAIAAGDDRLPDFHAKLVTTAEKARAIAGRKVMIIYGTSVLPLFNSLYAGAARAFRAVISEALPDFSFIQMPARCTPSGANGWIAANLDQTKLHYTSLPRLMKQGQNDEEMYLWHNFLMGSCMLDVMAKDAVVRQPATLA